MKTISVSGNADHMVFACTVDKGFQSHFICAEAKKKGAKPWFRAPTGDTTKERQPLQQSTDRLTAGGGSRPSKATPDQRSSVIRFGEITTTLAMGSRRRHVVKAAPLMAGLYALRPKFHHEQFWLVK